MYIVTAVVKEPKNVRPGHITLESASRSAQSIARTHRCTMVVRDADGAIVRKYDRKGNRI